MAFEKDGKEIFEKTVALQAEEIAPIERPRSEPTPKPTASEKMVTPEPRSAEKVGAEASRPSEQPAASVQLRRSPLKPVGITLLVIGTATLIPGIITGAMYVSEKRTLEERCPDNDSCSDDYESAAQKADSFSTATNILIPVGGVLTAVGIVLTVVGRRLSLTDKRVGFAPLGFAPLLDDNMAGLTISGRF